MHEYKTTVGIEVHAELSTKSKMFCGCKNAPHTSAPNTNICPVCLAHPGTLPVANEAAIEAVLTVGQAIGGTLADYSEFDRKNYFYPDIPKAYQISQYAYPLVSGGELAGVAITRIHLEEDTARSQHEGEHSLVDFNRAGVPLMELVTEPVIHDAATAGKFAKELQLLLRMLGVSEANMEKGEMRVEANISVSRTDALGTKVEVKNLNSFRAMEQAIEFETKRHIEMIESGEAIRQETRGWDEVKGKTFSQRSKETAEDYRYFPDPDIPKYVRTEIQKWSESRLAEKVPKLATELRSEYRDLGIKEDSIEVLLGTDSVRNFFEALLKVETVSTQSALNGANYLVSDVIGSEAESSLAADNDGQVNSFADLMSMVEQGDITSRVAKDLLPEVLQEAINPRQIAEERGLLQQNDTAALEALVETIIAENSAAVDEYKAGKETAIKFLVGQGMKASKGSANPALLLQLLEEKLS